MNENPPCILVIDVGGSHVKLLATNRRRPIRVSSGPKLTPAQMVAAVRDATTEWSYDAVSVGYPGPVVAGAPVEEPAHLGRGWVGFDFAAAFGRPVRACNDAAMQALGGYRSGRMLFLGLGTGLGSAMIVEGHLQPLELAHLPYRRKRTFEEYVGEASRVMRGKSRWRRYVVDVVRRLKAAMQADEVLIGGGNARHLQNQLDRLPAGTRLGGNADAFRGGIRLWLSADERVATASRRVRPHPTPADV